MKVGVLWKSYKENEKRYPIYWKHLNQLSQPQVDKLYFEENYPLINKVIHKLNILSRKDIFNECDVVIIPKPDILDYEYFRQNQILFGWMHTVQGYEITNIAIEKNLTYISWENMYKWTNNVKKEHIFSRNNELAGYASVIHFMELSGITPGVYGEGMKIAILGYGSTAKGAINALLGLGGTDITVFSKRSKFQIIDAIKNVKYETYEFKDGEVFINNNKAYNELINYNLIVNCVLQDPLSPMIFIRESNITNKINIIDISCDKGMGFDFAKPTSFDNPIIYHDKYIYYAVDHTPSYFWNSASYEISGALFPFLQYILDNDTYKGNETLEKAIDIESGIIINKAILEFQNRNIIYPYKILRK